MNSGFVPITGPLASEVEGQTPFGLLFDSSNGVSQVSLVSLSPAFGQVISPPVNLHVEHAVRNLPVTEIVGLYVQNAVRYSQLQAIVLAVVIGGTNSSAPGYLTLLDPFELGASHPADGAFNVSALPVLTDVVVSVPPPEPPVLIEKAFVEEKAPEVQVSDARATSSERVRTAPGLRSQLGQLAKDRKHSALPVTRSSNIS
jgi:hypothetical protein